MICLKLIEIFFFLFLINIIKASELTSLIFVALAPTSTSYMGQDFIANHMKSHYRRILSAKGIQ